MATWYWLGNYSNSWSDPQNWWSAPNGTGSHPPDAPWTTISTINDNLDLAISEFSTNPTITNGTTIGSPTHSWSILGTCIIPSIGLASSGGNTGKIYDMGPSGYSGLIFKGGPMSGEIHDGIFYGGLTGSLFIYGGNFYANNITSYCIIYDGIFSGNNFINTTDNFENVGSIFGGTFSGNNFINQSIITGGLFNGSNLDNSSGDIEGGSFVGSGFTWYWYDFGSQNWSDSNNWWSNLDGSGIHPPSAPWTVNDAGLNQNLSSASTAYDSPNIDYDLGRYFSIGGTCSINDLQLLPSVDIFHGGIYGGTYTGTGFTIHPLGDIWGGTFSGSGFVNNGYVDGGSFSGNNFINNEFIKVFMLLLVFIKI